jgi:hypothetical protein
VSKYVQPIFIRWLERTMLRKIILEALMMLLAIALGCGQQAGNNTLGATAGGLNGYGSIGGNNDFPVGLELIGTWRDNLSSPYFTQYKFNADGTCEFWIITHETSLHENGSYSIQINEFNITLRIVTLTHYLISEFYFDHGDLVFIGEGGNSIFHRVREKV